MRGFIMKKNFLTIAIIATAALALNAEVENIQTNPIQHFLETAREFKFAAWKDLADKATEYSKYFNISLNEDKNGLVINSLKAGLNEKEFSSESTALFAWLKENLTNFRETKDAAWASNNLLTKEAVAIAKKDYLNNLSSLNIVQMLTLTLIKLNNAALVTEITKLMEQAVTFARTEIAKDNTSPFIRLINVQIGYKPFLRALAIASWAASQIAPHTLASGTELAKDLTQNGPTLSCAAKLPALAAGALNDTARGLSKLAEICVTNQPIISASTTQATQPNRIALAAAAA